MLCASIVLLINIRIWILGVAQRSQKHHVDFAVLVWWLWLLSMHRLVMLISSSVASTFPAPLFNVELSDPILRMGFTACRLISAPDAQ